MGCIRAQNGAYWTVKEAILQSNMHRFEILKNNGVISVRTKRWPPQCFFDEAHNANRAKKPNSDGRISQCPPIAVCVSASPLYD